LAAVRDRLVTVDANAHLIEAVEILLGPTCRMVVVCDPAGVMMGVLTRTGGIHQIRPCHGCARVTQSNDDRDEALIVCHPNDLRDEIWAVMNEKVLHSIPVVDCKGRPIGLLSARGALEGLLASVECEEDLVRDYVITIGYADLPELDATRRIQAVARSVEAGDGNEQEVLR
jgi:predicted transcriptional regulator